MNRFIRALIAAWGAKKVGGGCLTTIVVFFIIYYALGTCNHPAHTSFQKKNVEAMPLHQTTLNIMRQSAQCISLCI